jgi:hypothetical protein
MLLLQRHATELRAFEDRWNDSEHLRKFAKPSSSLLEIKQIERSMVLTKMFDQAHSFKQKVRALEKVESGWAQDRAVSEMEKERDKLLRKQQLELENFDLHCARQTEVIRQAQELKKSAFNARQTKLASEIEDWTTHPATSLPLSSPPIFPKEVMTPRTAKRYSAFKRIAKPPVITVEPLGRVAPTKRKRPATASSI